jgi:hypothetical protein
LARARISACGSHSDLPDDVSATMRLETYNLRLDADGLQKAVLRCLSYQRNFIST